MVKKSSKSAKKTKDEKKTKNSFKNLSWT